MSKAETIHEKLLNVRALMKLAMKRDANRAFYLDWAARLLRASISLAQQDSNKRLAGKCLRILNMVRAAEAA